MLVLLPGRSPVRVKHIRIAHAPIKNLCDADKLNALQKVAHLRNHSGLGKGASDESPKPAFKVAGKDDYPVLHVDLHMCRQRTR